MTPRPYRKKGENKTCKCGIVFYCPRWDLNERKYCSKKCGYAYKKYGYEVTPEIRKRMSIAKTGQAVSPEARKKIGDFWRGKKFSEERKARHKLFIKRGSESPVWIKDRTKLKRFGDENKDRRSSAYGAWRKEVWLRDNFTCKIANPNCSGRIEAHHILSWHEHQELRYEVNNGITLCHFHHPRKRNDEVRLSPYFQELVNTKIL